MQVLPQCGHAVQEDTPDRVAEVLATFLIRHKLATPKSEFHRYVTCGEYSTLLDLIIVLHVINSGSSVLPQFNINEVISH